MLLPAVLMAQKQPLFFKIDSPHFIPVNKDFELSLTCRITEAKYDELNLFILTEDQINITDVVIKNLRAERKLKFREAKFADRPEKSYKVKLPLDDPLMKLGNPFQIILSFDGNESENSEVNFAMEMKRQKNGTSVYSSFNLPNQSNGIEKANLSFYKPFRSAGSAINLNTNSSFVLTFNKDRSYKNLLVEFWAKLNNYSSEFFNVFDLNTGDTLISLVNTPFKMVYAKETHDLKYITSNFASRNAWIHFSIRFSKSFQSIDVYADDVLLFSRPFRSLSKLSDLVFTFSNESPNGVLSIDLLKIWDFQNSMDLSFRNKNFLTYAADSSSLLLKCDFDDPGQVNSSIKNLYTIQFSGGEIRESDAPIFPRTPDLNLMKYNNFYSIEWTGRDLENAFSYTLEKSTDNKKFTQIYTVEADRDPSKIYYYSDEKDPLNEIVIYRLKQINKDGSVIYSPQTKIGQGQKKTFIVDQNYPNPFNPFTSITVNIIEPDEFEIRVYDLVGKKIALLHSGPLSVGQHSFHFDGTDLPSGIYFYEVKSPKSLEVRKMILTK